MSNLQTRKRAAYFCVILILVLLMIIGGLRILESTIFHEEIQIDRVSKTITRNGVEYFPRQDITVIMVLGIDESGPAVSSGSYENEGRCDAVMLLILDHAAENYRVLSLNRDTMTTMPALGIGGRQAGTYYGQLAYAHCFGDGLETSCENTRTTVSDMLYGITIDHYVSLNMDAISIINDAVGGVTVNITDDFSGVDPSMTKGEMTLMGDQALTFVRSRRDVGDRLNTSRMERQEEYVDGLIEAVREKNSENGTFLIDLYEQVAAYMVTDCSVNAVAGYLDRCTHYPLAEIVTPEGKNVLGDEYYEFYLDENKLDDLVLRLFYAQKR